MTRITGTLDEDTFLISRSVLFRMRNVADKFVKITKDTFHVQGPFFKSLAIVDPARPQTTV
jgi:hypothetical protein